jgi:hypothetical protein
MINRRSVPALQRACLHQRKQPEVKAPDANLCPNLLKTDMTADRVRHVPADRPQDDVPFEVTALELDHHMRAAETVAGKRTPGGSVGQICDRTAWILYATLAI